MKEIYLAGSVPKGDKEQESFIDWRVKWSGILLKFFNDAQIIDPYNPNLD